MHWSGVSCHRAMVSSVLVQRSMLRHYNRDEHDGFHHHTLRLKSKKPGDLVLKAMQRCDSYFDVHDNGQGCQDEGNAHG